MNRYLPSVVDYFKQKAEKWVSGFVLIGFVAIAVMLVYSAVQADVLGNKLVTDDVRSFLQE